MTTTEPLIPTGEVARRLGVDPATINAWVRQDRLTPAVRTAGGRLRFRWTEVAAELHARGAGPRATV